MSDLFGLTGSELVFGTLLFAGIGHVRHRRALVDQLEQQGALPRHARRLVASMVAPAELLVGSLGLVTLAVGVTVAVTAALAFVAYGCFTAFALVLWRHRPGVPCGCSASDEPVSGWTVVRAGVLALVSGALLVAADTSPGWTWSVGVPSVPMAAALGLLVWQLPTAMQAPVTGTTRAGGEP